MKLSRPTLLLLPSMMVLGFFFVVPIILNVLMSFRNSGTRDTGGLRVYFKIFTDPYYLLVLAKTLGLGLVVTLITLVLGYPVGYFLARTRSKHKSAITFLIIAPLLISMVIRCYGWMLTLGGRGIVNTFLLDVGLVKNPLELMYNWTGVIIAVVHVLLPYVILSISSVVEGIDLSVEDSARVFGANPIQTFFRITLPLSVQGIATGATLAFLLTIGSFVTVLMLGGKNTMVLSLLIFQQITVTFNEAFAAALGTTLMGIAILLLVAQFKLLKRWA
jgi:putative spermidine/putrescine transport system permease protein